MIEKLNKEIENFINSDNDWMRKTYEVDEANTYNEFLLIVKEFINKIKTPIGHKKIVGCDRCVFEARNSRISIDFKFINQNKSITNIDGVFSVNVL
jgi:hypothetical protein